MYKESGFFSRIGAEEDVRLYRNGSVQLRIE